MKMTVLSAGLGAPHAGWASIDEFAFILERCFSAELLAAKPAPQHWLRRVSGKEKMSFLPIDSSGGDVLFVVARGPEDLAAVRAIADVRKKFSRIYAFITDSYFHDGYVSETELFDGITVTAHEDVHYPAQRFGIMVHQLYQGTDCLQWAPRTSYKREIDVMAFGRTPPSYQAAFTAEFHRMQSPYLYLHSPLGNLHGPTVGLERGMLFKLLHRSKIAMAFHLLVEPQGNRPRSMMVTSRWLESLMSGCIVVGRRPVSRMACEMLCWDNATTELPQDTAQAVKDVQAMLARDEQFELQRKLNIYNTVARHDWRDRISTLCQFYGWQEPTLLRDEKEQLLQLREQWQAA